MFGKMVENLLNKHQFWGKESIWNETGSVVASMDEVMSQPHLEFSSCTNSGIVIEGVSARRWWRRSLQRPRHLAPPPLGNRYLSLSASINAVSAPEPAALSVSRSLQANGIRFLAAEIPPRTFTPRPTEINRSFNTNSTTLSPHWQTDEHFRFSLYLPLSLTGTTKRSASSDVSASSVIHNSTSLFYLRSRTLTVYRWM